MIHCILGHGASGKTTIQKNLKEHIPAITTYTTRPMRTNEIDGVHYHFLTNDQFLQKINANFFVEYYHIPENNWYYGMSLHDIDYFNQDYTLVIDPQGYRTLLDIIGKEHLMCYYVNLSDTDRYIRMLYRGDKPKEIQRRIFSDLEDFDGFEEFSDVILTSKNSKENSDAILKLIKERAF